MPHFSIKKFPNPVLRKPCTLVKSIDKTTKAFIDRLIATMYAQPGGIGIAAPQVGISKQIAIVDVSPKDPKAQRLVLINPRIIRSQNKHIFREGCMSLPDYTANVIRYTHVELEYLNLSGRKLRFWAEGIEAICIQHEVDHLNGKLFIDRVASLKRDVFRRRRYL